MISRQSKSTLFPYTTLFRSDRPIGPAARRLFEPSRAEARARHFLALKDSLGTQGVLKGDRKSTRLNSSHRCNSYAVFCLKKKKFIVLFEKKKINLVVLLLEI